VKRIAMLIVVASLAAACGGKDGGNPNSPSAQPQPYTQTVVGTVSSFGAVHHPLTVPRSGNMTLTLTWPGGGDLDFYLTPASCQVYPLNGGCQILVASDSATGSSETILRPVTQGDTYTLWVDSFVTGASRNYTIDITIR